VATMKVNFKKLIRKFKVGKNQDIIISDLGDISLNSNEQITFLKDTGARYDFVSKDWGYYVTPSINGRLRSEGFKVALVENEVGRLYVMAVELSKLNNFEDYCLNENQTLIEWLDDRERTTVC
jgi:hypothetical protein